MLKVSDLAANKNNLYEPTAANYILDTAHMTNTVMQKTKRCFIYILL